MSAVLQPPKPGIEGGIEVTRTLSGQAAFEQDGLLTPAALAFLAMVRQHMKPPDIASGGELVVSPRRKPLRASS